MPKSPPNIAKKFFHWYCNPRLQETILGDLEEQFEEDIKDYGLKRARRRFVWNVIRFFRPGIIKSVSGGQKLNTYGMFKNYVKVGIRNILKYKMFSFINVFGLAVAMSVCMLIILMLADQKSYDKFHNHKENVYRVLGIPEIGSIPYATTPLPTAASIKEESPMVEEVVTMRRGVGGDASYNQKTIELKGYFTNNSFFDVFSFDLESGDPLTALNNPNSIVITKEKAYQLFNDTNPIGKQVMFEDRGLHIIEIESGRPPVKWGTFTVTGVIDLSLCKTHLKFEALMSASTLPGLYKESLIADVSNDWEHHWASYSYIKAKEDVSQTNLNGFLAEMAKRKFADSEDLKNYTFSAQRLTEITPGILVNNEPTFRLPEIAYYILSLLALVIMVMACLNYTNLSIARSLSRMKEIGVRKVTGATKNNLIFQFLTESVITVFFALFFALGILYFTKEAFMDLWFNKYLNFQLSSSLSVLLLFILFAFIVGIIAGTYPALFLSRKKPINALKSSVATKGKFGIQKFLNVTQFVVSLVFIVTSMVIYDQFKHYMNFEYGFNTENVINVPLQSNDYEMMASELSKIPGVISISACDYVPATGITNVRELIDINEEKDPITLLNFNVDQNFIDNFDLNVLNGQAGFDQGESGKYIVINESAVEKLGYESAGEAIGKVWKSPNTEKSIQIIGVVENFRATLLVNGHEIRPMALSNDISQLNYLNIRISEGNPMSTIESIEQKWKGLDPIHEFRYDFYENELANTNLAIFDIVSIIGYISFLAILIACLGLLGMAIYTTEQKTKEVGIRKVLGAAEMKIVLLLSKSFLKLLLIAILIAAPLSYFANKLWLDNLPNRMEFGFGTVAIGSLLMLTLGLITIGSQTIRAARQNPAESLKDE